jgi:Tol biopolymer transport system component
VAVFGGRIVFVSYRDGDEEIYIMNADGSNQTRLTYSQYGDTEPVLSPDGRHIVFVSQRAGGHRLFIMNSDGSDQRPLTDGKSSDEYDPYYSPEGQWIVFSTSRGGRFDLWLIRPDGTGPTQLTSGPNGKNLPAWSPDGQWIAYNSIQNGIDTIKVTRLDGAWVTIGELPIEGDRNQPVTIGGVTATFEEFRIGVETANGQRIIWVGNRRVGRAELQEFHGTTNVVEDRVLLTLEGAYISGWIGGRILFVAKNGATTDLYSMAPDGSNIQQLTSDPANDKGAFGTPDGQFVIFNSSRDGNDEIYVMKPDGSNQIRLTSNAGNDYMPTWGP